MAPHSSTLAWKIPWSEEPGRLQSMGSRRFRYDWATYFHFSLSCIGEGNGNPLQCSCLENPRDGGAWWAAVYGVTQSRTRLKWLSSKEPLAARRRTDQGRERAGGLGWQEQKLETHLETSVMTGGREGSSWNGGTVGAQGQRWTMQSDSGCVRPRQADKIC